MNSTLFYHGKTTDGRRFTVAGTVESTKILKRGKINMGLSLCSRQDSFVKKVGRVKAEGRLHARKDKGRVVLKFDIPLPEPIKTFINVTTQFNLLGSKELLKRFNLSN